MRKKGKERGAKGIGNNLKRNRRRFLFYSGQWSVENRNKKKGKGSTKRFYGRQWKIIQNTKRKWQTILVEALQLIKATHDEAGAGH